METTDQVIIDIANRWRACKAAGIKPYGQLSKVTLGPAIVRLLDRYGAELPGDETPISDTGWQAMACPFHDDHKMSAALNEDRGVFQCFACKIAGNASQIRKQVKRLHTEFWQRKELAEQLASLDRDIARMRNKERTEAEIDAHIRQYALPEQETESSLFDKQWIPAQDGYPEGWVYVNRVEHPSGDNGEDLADDYERLQSAFGEVATEDDDTDSGNNLAVRPVINDDDVDTRGKWADIIKVRHRSNRISDPTANTALRSLVIRDGRLVRRWQTLSTKLLADERLYEPEVPAKPPTVVRFGARPAIIDCDPLLVKDDDEKTVIDGRGARLKRNRKARRILITPPAMRRWGVVITQEAEAGYRFREAQTAGHPDYHLTLKQWLPKIRIEAHAHGTMLSGNSFDCLRLDCPRCPRVVSTRKKLKIEPWYTNPPDDLYCDHGVKCLGWVITCHRCLRRKGDLYR